MAPLAIVPELLAGLGEAGAAAGAGEAAAGAGAAAEAGASAGATAGAATAAPSAASTGGRFSSMLSDFNDSPVGRIVGSDMGKKVMSNMAQQGVESAVKGGAKMVGSAFGGGNVQRINIGAMGNEA